MTWHVTKTTPIHFIDSKCHIKQLKVEKTLSISHHIIPLVINVLRVGIHTHRHTDTHIHTETNQNNFKKPDRPVCAWFKNYQMVLLCENKTISYVHWKRTVCWVATFIQTDVLCISGKTDCIISCRGKLLVM